MEKYRILCFGDSLTWGCIPGGLTRMDEDKRWTGVLQELLGENFKVIEEGQKGRTIATEDPSEGEKNGIKYVIPCIESQEPLDLMIIMLGTNDMKRKFSYSALEIAIEMDLFLEKVQAHNRFHLDDRMKVLLIAPPQIIKPESEVWTDEFFDFDNAAKISAKLPALYKGLADKFGCMFMDAGEFVKASSLDGIHLDEENQTKLGKEIYTMLKKSGIIK